MSRYPYPEEEYLIGENYFPISGGLIIENLGSHLHIFPSFPIGAGMPDQGSFELHLHRNPDKDDGLGIKVYYGEYSPVEHSIVFGFTELQPRQIWKKYLSQKSIPQVFFKGHDNTLVEDFEIADKTNNKWEYDTEYSLVNENKCAYISSIVQTHDNTICRILNICDFPITPEFNSFELLEELNTLGGKIEKRQIAIAKGLLEFEINNNSAKNFIQYPKSRDDGLIQPFHLNTFKIKQIVMDA